MTKNQQPTVEIKGQETIIEAAERTSKDVKLEDSAIPKNERLEGLEILTGKTSTFEYSDVIGISRYTYVHDIHVANPSVIDTIWWVNLKNHRNVVLRITENTFNEILKNVSRKKIQVLYVYNSINEQPYARQYVKYTPEWPTMAEIDTMDKEISKIPGQETWVSRDQRHKAEKNVVYEDVELVDEVEEPQEDEVPARS